MNKPRNDLFINTIIVGVLISFIFGNYVVESIMNNIKIDANCIGSFINDRNGTPSIFEQDDVECK